jgi:molybdate transport system ATP-binding protein
LIPPDQGRVEVDGHVLVDTERRIFVPKHKRRIGYIFQDARLFPHLTVRQNLLFGKWFAPHEGQVTNFDDIVALLGIGHLLERGSRALSGGEKQRVAIGRALLARPRLLLMDEPLASLDEQRKEEIFPYLERLRDETGVPIVLVSHAIAEVARLATTVVMMVNGRVNAVGRVGDVMSRLDVASTVDLAAASTVIEARVAAHDDRFRLTCLDSPGGAINVPRLNLIPGAAVRVRIRARDVIIATARPADISALNVLKGTITEVGPENGSARDIRLDLGGQSILANLTLRSIAELKLAPGQQVFAVVKSVAIDGRRSAEP